MARRTTPTLSAHHQHPLSQRSSAFQANRNHSRLSALQKLQQASGEPQSARKVAQLAGILTVILIASLAAVMGLFPELNESRALDSTVHGAAANITEAGLPDSLNGQPLEKQFAAIENLSRSQAMQAEMLNALGVSYLSRNDAAKAAECFTKSISTNPELIAAHNNLGTAMLQNGNGKAARCAFQETLKLQPNNDYASRQLIHLQ